MNYRKKPMLKINFFLRNSEKSKPDDRCVIYCQMEIEGYKRDTPFSTQIKIPKKHWRNGTVDRQYLFSEDANKRLNLIQLDLKNIYDGLFVLQGHVSYQDIKTSYCTKTLSVVTKKVLTFVETFDMFIQSKLIDWSPGTIKNYRTRRKNIIEFLIHTKQIDIPIDCIRYKTITSYIEWMKQRGVESKMHVNKHAHCFKQVLDYALNHELIKHHTIGKLGLKNDTPKPAKYLTHDLRERIRNIKMPALQVAIDIAKLLWSTGFSYTDYLSLKPEHLIESIDGACFKKQRLKTKIYSFPPLLPEAKSIIDKYNGIEHLPKPDISDLNKLLKFVGDFTGINSQNFSFNLSTSVFRETFASMMENEYMMDHRTIMYMMGHTNPKQLGTYSSVMPQRIMYELKQSRKYKLINELDSKINNNINTFDAVEYKETA